MDFDSSIKDAHILIVDDQPLSIKLMEALLNQKGFKTSSATNGQAALDFLENNSPDLIMLDIMMPGMSGFEVSKHVKENPKTAEIPIIFVTARDDAETINECFAAGGSDYAAKPLRIYELLTRIKLQLTTQLHLKRAKKSEEDLEENQLFLKTIIDANPSFIHVMNADGQFQMVNKHFADIFNISPEQMHGKTAEELINDLQLPEDTITTLTKNYDRTLQSGRSSLSVEEVFFDHNNQENWVISSKIPIGFGDSQFILSIHQDITKRKLAEVEKSQLEEQLVHSQRMEVIGTLAGGIAHDFNNMLAVILGFADLAKNTLPEEARQRRHLDEVITAGNRAKDLVKQILNFSRQSKGEHQPLMLMTIVKEVVKMMQTTLPSSISASYYAAPEMPMIDADPSQMHQVIMNLCVNANQAMPNGGELKIFVEHLPESSSSFGLKLIGPHIHLTISDTGSGISEAVQKRIFEPYFTTKEIGKGTGLGLAVVHGIISQHNGQIHVESEMGKGTSFHIFFPALDSAREMDHTQAEMVVNQGQERIMVVDDEPMLAELVKETLEAYGYHPTTFTDSVKAYNYFQEHPNDFDLVISDYMMPEMQGDTLAINIRKINKRVPIILATGFSQNITEERAKAIGITKFLMKPIIGADLCHAIQECLNQSASQDG